MICRFWTFYGIDRAGGGEGCAEISGIAFGNIFSEKRFGVY